MRPPRDVREGKCAIPTNPGTGWVLETPHGGETGPAAGTGRDELPADGTSHQHHGVRLERAGTLCYRHLEPRRRGKPALYRPSAICPRPAPQHMLDTGPQGTARSTTSPAPPPIPASVSTSVEGSEPDLRGAPQGVKAKREEPATLPSPSKNLLAPTPRAGQSPAVLATGCGQASGHD